MAVDLSVFSRIKTKQDFDREAEDFNMRKALTQSQIQKANQLASGDVTRKWADPIQLTDGQLSLMWTGTGRSGSRAGHCL